MPKNAKYCFIIIGWCIIALIPKANAQCDSLPIKLPNNILVSTIETEVLYNQLLDSLIYIIRSDYILDSQNSLHKNRNGKDVSLYYGRRWGVGVRIENTLFFDALLQLPQAIKQYTDTPVPNLSRVDICPIFSTHFTQIPFIDNHPAYSHISSAPLSHDLPNHFQSGEIPASGKLWLIYPVDATVQNPRFIKKLCTISPHWIGDEATPGMSDILRENLIGGILFYEHYTSGSLKIIIGGILTQQNNSDWKINKLPPIFPLTVSDTTPSTVKQVSNGF